MVLDSQVFFAFLCINLNPFVLSSTVIQAVFRFLNINFRLFCWYPLSLSEGFELKGVFFACLQLIPKFVKKSWVFRHPTEAKQRYNDLCHWKCCSNEQKFTSLESHYCFNSVRNFCLKLFLASLNCLFANFSFHFFKLSYLFCYRRTERVLSRLPKLV